MWCVRIQSFRQSGLLCLENRITLDVNPVGRARWEMAALAVFCEGSCDLLIGCVAFVKRPSPTLSPKRIAREPSFLVLDHDEPHFRSLCPMSLPSRQETVIGPKDFLDEHGSIRKLASLAVMLSGAR